MTPTEALALLKAKGLLTLVPGLTTAVAGEPIRGSWWSHPRGKEIFAISSALDDHPDVAVVKLVGGKVTFVHRQLWPALYRVVSEAADAKLSPAAKRLLAKVRSAGELRLDKPDKARGELEKALLVYSRQEHTARGAHVAVLSTWERWADAATKKAAAKLTLEQARAML